MFFKKILFLSFFGCLSFILQGQGDYRIYGKSIPELRREKEQKTVYLPDHHPIYLLFRPSAPPAVRGLLQAPGRVPTAYSYEMLGVFCKFEVQLERAARFPIKFRLGEVQYTEGLEGKDRWNTPGKYGASRIFQ